MSFNRNRPRKCFTEKWLPLEQAEDEIVDFHSLSGGKLFSDIQLANISPMSQYDSQPVIESILNSLTHLFIHQ